MKFEKYIEVQRLSEGYHVWLRYNNQSFRVAPVTWETLAEANWYAEQLDKALVGIFNETN